MFMAPSAVAVLPKDIHHVVNLQVCLPTYLVAWYRTVAHHVDA